MENKMDDINIMIKSIEHHILKIAYTGKVIDEQDLLNPGAVNQQIAEDLFTIIPNSYFDFSYTHLSEKGLIDVVWVDGEALFFSITSIGIDQILNPAISNQAQPIFNISNSNIGSLTGNVYIENYINEMVEEYKEDIESIEKEKNIDTKQKSIKKLATKIATKSIDRSVDIVTGLITAFISNKLGL